jgi:hypothetical protein
MPSIVIKESMCESENGKRIGDDKCGAQKRIMNMKTVKRNFLPTALK